jgi:hypothetical protein
MPEPAIELLKGTLDLFILRTLDLRPLHGSAIAERIFFQRFIAWNRKAGSRASGRIHLKGAASGRIR